MDPKQSFFHSKLRQKQELAAARLKSTLSPSASASASANTANTANSSFYESGTNQGYGRAKRTQAARIRGRVQRHDALMMQRGFESEGSSGSEEEVENNYNILDQEVEGDEESMEEGDLEQEQNEYNSQSQYPTTVNEMHIESPKENNDDDYFDEDSSNSYAFYGTTKYIQHFYKVLKAIDPSKSNAAKSFKNKSTEDRRGGNQFNVTYEGVLGDPLNLGGRTANNNNNMAGFDPEDEMSNNIVNVKITHEGMVFSVGKAHTGMSGFFVDRQIFSKYDVRIDSEEDEEEEALNNQDPENTQPGQNTQKEQNEDEKAKAYRFALPLQPLLNCLKIMATNEVPRKTVGEFGEEEEEEEDYYDSSDEEENDKYGLRRAGFGGVAAEAGRETRKFRKTQIMFITEGIQRFLLVFEGSHGTKTVCEFKVMEPEEDEEMDGDRDDDQRGFNPKRVALRAIFKGPMLGRAIKALMNIDTQQLTIRGANRKKRLEFISDGNVGLSLYTFPKDAEDFESLKVIEVEPDWDEMDLDVDESEPPNFSDMELEDDDDDNEDIFMERVAEDEYGNRVLDPESQRRREAKRQAKEELKMKWQQAHEQKYEALRQEKLDTLKQEYAQRMADPTNQNKKITVEHSYIFSQVATALMGVTIGSKQNLRCDSRGFMNIQSMYRLEPKNPDSSLHIYMDYRFSPSIFG